MCLLVVQPEGVVFSDAFLKGVYTKNSDGIGVMYVENEELVVTKGIPNNFDEMKAFYEEHIKERECAWHNRMKTHGLIDLDNCHPYEVLTEEDGYPLWMMHNGVLYTGNAKNPSMSDTWHYIQNYLRPMLKHNPEWFMTDEFADLVSSHIGTGNKFTFMDAKGNIITLNEDKGVEYNGAWLSNTYAWETEGTEHGYKRPAAYSSHSYGGYSSYYAGNHGNNVGAGHGAWDEYDDYVPYRAQQPSNVVSLDTKKIEIVQQMPLDINVDDSEKKSEAVLTQGASEGVMTDAEWVAWIERQNVWLDDVYEYAYATFHVADIDEVVDFGALESYYQKVGEQAAWDVLSKIYTGDLSLFSLFNLAAALNHTPAKKIANADLIYDS